jgi:hypothetical protein
MTPKLEKHDLTKAPKEPKYPNSAKYPTQQIIKARPHQVNQIRDFDHELHHSARAAKYLESTCAPT